jgi:pentapeptide MXKDX repeat protein
MVRRFAMLALSLALLLGLTGGPLLLAQDPPKKDEAKKEEPKKDETKKDETKKDEVKKDEAKQEETKKDEVKKEEPPRPIPPEVEAKLEAARRAVAEAIVAAQDAGLVTTSIDPPPILDILITGRATDEAAVKLHMGVNPEVFGAWFTGYGKTSGVTAQSDVRIVQPSQGLKSWYDQRAEMLNRHIDAVRKAKGPASKKEEPKKDEVKKEEPKKDEVKKEEPSKDEPKKEEPKKDEPKKDEPKKDESK